MKTSSYILRILTGAALVITPAVALSQSSSTSSSSAMSASSSANASSVPATDKKFIREAAEGGMAEVELGRLATEKASNEDVKKFGERMVNDHSKADDKLKQIAGNDGVSLPDKMDASSERLLNKLKKMSGAQFDREYMSEMVSDHQKDIREFEKEAKSGRNGDIKQFANETLPTLREHLTLAQTAKQAAMGEKRGASTGKAMNRSTVGALIVDV